ncbi:unnamed protein product [Caenorhabditis auriculariae]|uniref:Carboxylesterase type B domain-containing protein n=1 Tax=Caenorhabditis auriculariae TaxID=2777116 RepID=A0A8S1H409_9PELO|nr:unnamed protein product [Caenorhabditis auriculariae]
MLGYLGILAIFSQVPSAFSQPPVRLNLPQGEIVGFHVDYGSDTSQLYYGQGDVFLGIPYVQPPVGNLRFQKPRPLEKFPGNSPYNATYYRPACPQFDNFGALNISEDCLQLNVFTPSVNSLFGYPVMVWIHGGGFVSGYAESNYYKGAIRNLVSHGVVIVTIQYRLGLLGFFTTHSPEFPPNLGLLDQVEALRWVKNNIAHFGGNPNQVTIFGQSAGSCSVSAHTYSPLSRNLFHAAIMESATALTCFEGALSFSNHSYRRAQALCNTTADDWTRNRFGPLKACLMGMDFRKWTPLDLDSNFMPGVPLDLARDRKNIPIMIGNVANEYTIFDIILISSGQATLQNYTRQSFENVLKNFASAMGEHLPDVTKIVEKAYVPPGTTDDDHDAWVEINDRAFTGGGFTGFTAREVDWWLAGGNQQVYLYEFADAKDTAPVVGAPQIPGWKPVPHTSEVYYIWMNGDIWTNKTRQDLTSSQVGLLDWMGETWTNFAKFGIPRLDGFWRPVPSRDQLDYLLIGNGTLDMKPNFRHTDVTIYDKVIPAIVGDLPVRLPDYNNGTYPPPYSFMLGHLGILAIFSQVPTAFSQPSVRLNLPQGEIVGFHVDYGSDTSQLYYGQGDVFLGIPYVQPPVGNLRFQKPRPLEKFPGNSPYNATYYRPACPQSQILGALEVSEDCLQLNVFTPSVNTRSSYPVMVWIHGGSLVFGNASWTHYSGAIRNLVSHGVVVVTIQYRLGVLGFFTTHSPDFPPNLGMLDQVEALRWVKSNIAHFGGNPNQVTIFGQSAGSCSVSAHTYSPLSRNLFQAAIMESGTALTCFEGALSDSNQSFRRAQAFCNTTLEDWNNANFGPLKACLMAMDHRMMSLLDLGFQELGWKMVQDDYFMPGVPLDLARDRKNIPIMIGNVANEYSSFDLTFLAQGITTIENYTRQHFEEIVQGFTSLGSRLPEVTKILEKAYVPPGTTDDDHYAWIQINDKVMTGAAFTGFTVREADWWLAGGNNQVYLYEFADSADTEPVSGAPEIPGWKPVPHTAEVYYIWMNGDIWKNQANLKNSQVGLLEWMGETWTNFAKFGIPRLDGFWRPVPSRDQLDYLLIGNGTLDMKTNFRHTDAIIFDKVIPALVGDLPMLGHLGILAIFFRVPTAFSQAPVRLNLPQGEIVGFHVDYGSDTSQLYYGQGDVFLGIPYVQPPVGILRFQKPRPLEKFPGSSPYNATYYRPACPQSDFTGSMKISEDCLQLNVFTPSVNTRLSYPVMVWIHGGALLSGSAEEYNYKGAVRNLVSRGVVVVTIQYRLGMLGFFTTHSPDFSPNLGMLDQVEALRWVKNNIAHFGGNPNQVTIFGQSAGSCSVSAHTYSPLSRNLFQAAIMESGTVLICFEGALSFSSHSYRRAQALCGTTAQDWTTNRFEPLKACLMGMDYRQMVALDMDIQENMVWKMSQDSYFMPGVPSDLARGRPNIPIMIGNVANEYSFNDLLLLKLRITTLQNYTRQHFEELAQGFSAMSSHLPEIIKIMEKTYVPPGTTDDDHSAWIQINDKAFSGLSFTGFTAREVDWLLAGGNNQVYLYEFADSQDASDTPATFGAPAIPGWTPVPHTAEISYIWMNGDIWKNQANLKNSQVELLDWMGETWTSFAKFGIPRLDGFWRPVPSRDQLDYLLIGNGTLDMKPNFRQTDDIIFNKVIPAIVGDLPVRLPDFNNGTFPPPYSFV